MSSKAKQNSSDGGTPKMKTIKKTRSKKRSAIVFQVVCILILSIIAFCQIFPFFLKVVDSLQDPEFIPDSDKLYLWPEDATLENYLTAMQVSGFWKALANTLFVSIVFTAISLLIAIVVGYALAKLQFNGKKLVSNLLLCTMMVPGEVLMIPNYILVMEMGLNYSIWGLILPGIVNVFGIFLVRQYMSNIPRSVLESAEVDGCGEIRKIFQIVVPMAKPVLITYVILTFVSSWNDYLWPMIMQASGSQVETLQLIMYKFYPGLGNYADGFVRSAGMILITIPIIIMYLIFQKYFLNQNNLSGIK
ncbi:MAG: carbohydrate ABC transporter permease [Clostridia bacterium]|nr:carbohydrate ABC transporter permease [Clostridia bacterium]